LTDMPVAETTDETQDETSDGGIEAVKLDD